MPKLEIKVLQAGDEALLETFLLPRIASSMFLLGNMRRAGLVDQGKLYQGTYAAALLDGVIAAVVALYWNGNLIFQASSQQASLIQAVLEAADQPVLGLIGPAQQVQQGKTLLEIPDEIIQLDETEDLFRLDLAELRIPPALSSGELRGRRINAADLDLQAEWRAAYLVEALGEMDTTEMRAQARRAIEGSLESGRTWVLEHYGEPVASSSFNAAVAEAVQVGGVWTPPVLRSRGYARAVVAASLLEARAAGARIAILFTGKDNIPAQKAYLALGFEITGDYRMLLLRQAFRPKSRLC